MRAHRLLSGLVLIASGVFAQTASPGDSVSALFASGLASSLLNADTVPASITSVRSALDFGGGFNYLASGSWIEISGAGLSTNTRTWAGGDFSGVNAPTSLDGVSVTVNNRPAFVYYISPTQLNVQVPDDTSTGPVEVRVSNGTSGTATASSTKMALAPGILAPASFNVGGRQYMVANFPPLPNQGLVYVGRTNLIQGVAFRPAKPGDAITAYGIGFGGVTPSIASGIVVQQSNEIARPVTLAFGQTAATITYKGLAPGYVGLYQFNFVVPNVADGDYQINMTLDGQPLPQPAMFLTVQR